MAEGTAIMKARIVASDRPVWSGEVKLAVVPSTEGEIGIMSNHEPVMTTVAQGVLSVTELNGVKHEFQVEDGFVAFHDNQLIAAMEQIEIITSATE